MKNRFKNGALGHSVHRLSGTVLIFALIVLAIGAIAMAGWVYVMGGLVEYTDALRDGVNRRIKLENSRAMAVQYARQYVISGSTVAAMANNSVTWNSYQLGGLTLGPTGANPLTTVNLPNGSDKFNPFAPAGASPADDGYFVGFSQTISTSLFDGTNQVPWKIQARSRAPFFGYDLVSLLSMTNASSLSMSSGALGTSMGPRKTGGGFLNIPSPPEIPSTLSFTSYSGASVIWGGVTIPVISFVSTSTDTRFEAAKTLSSTPYVGSGSSTVTYHLYKNVQPMIFKITDQSTRQLVFTATGGLSPANAAEAGPILIQCTSTYNGLSITVPRGNRRRLYLCIDSKYNFTLSIPSGGTGNTRLLAVFGGATFSGTSRPTISLPSSLTIEGGFRTRSSSLSISGGTLSVIRELSSFSILDLMGQRRAWVETYRDD